MTTLYQMPNGHYTESYQCFKDAKAEHAAAQAAFDNRFGALLSTPEGRRAAVDGMRAGALEKSGIVRVVPAPVEYSKGLYLRPGLTKEDIDRRVDVGNTAVTNRHGAEVFAIPEVPTNYVSGQSLPPGMTRVSFFGGVPES